MSIQIMISARNSRRVTELSMHVASKYKGPESELIVYNNHPDEYEDEFLEQYADQVIKPGNKTGVHALKLQQLKKFLESGHEYLYLTDSSAIHDPEYISRLKHLYSRANLYNGINLPVCLYNSITSNPLTNQLLELDTIIVQRAAHGISFFSDQSLAERLVRAYAAIDVAAMDHEGRTWDGIALKLLQLPSITSKTSYLEQFAEPVLHPSAEPGGRDSAIVLTTYLENLRESAMNYFLAGGSSPVSRL